MIIEECDENEVCCLTSDEAVALDMAIKALEQEPTRKKGKWIKTKEGKYKCSNCKGEHSDPQTGKWYEVFDFKYPYCPNCGAEMENE